MASTPIKIKRIPRPTHKAKTITRLTSNIVGGAGVTVTRSGLTYTVASSAVIVPDTPVTNHAIARFTGITGNVLEDSLATISDGGTLDINPIPASTNKGIDIAQTGPTSGSNAGPLFYNNIDVTSGGTVTTGGVTTSDDGLRNDCSRALDVSLTVGASTTGFTEAAVIRLKHMVATDIVFGDHIGMVVNAYSQANANGKGLYSANIVTQTASGASHTHIVGANIEMLNYTGSSFDYRAGVRLQTDSASGTTVRGAVSDAAVTTFTSPGSGSLWGNFVTFNEWGENCHLSTGDLFNTRAAFTTANVFNLPTVTVTGNILSFPKVTLTGAGILTLNPNTAALSAPVPNTVIHAGNVDGSGSYITLDSFANDTALLGRRANGTAAAKTALTSGDLISAFGALGYGATGYSSTSRALIAMLAHQNWTDANQGASIDFRTTADNSTTLTSRAVLYQGLTMAGATGGDQGAGTINATALYCAGGSLQALTNLSLVNNGWQHFIASGGTFTGNRILTLTLNDAARTIDLGGNLTLAGAASFPAIAIGDVLYGSGTGALSALSAVAAGAVFSSNGAGAAPIWDTTPYISGSVAVGANTAVNSGVLLQLNANTAALPTPTFTGTVFQIGGADASAVRVYMDAFSSTGNQSSTYVFRKARGTAASRSAIQTSDFLGAFFWDGFDGTGYNATDAPSIIGFAGENFSTTAHGSGFYIRTVPNGGLTSALSATFNPSGGIVLSTATGGDKGLGTLNAIGVYDDNTLLTCYPFDQVLDGTIDVVKWDALTPNRKKFKRKPGPDGQMIDVPDGEEVRTHEPLRKFMARIGTKHDPMQLESYVAHWKEKRHLTSFPNEAKFDPEKGLTTGEWIQRLVETVELQAIHMGQLLDRIKVLESSNPKPKE